jgi:hypothetical protein
MKDQMTAQVDGERGAAAILVAISLLVLVGFAALALDGGLGFDERRGTQNAADSAALAAAWESCNPRVAGAPDPAGSALAVAAQNGYDDTDPEVVVTVNQLDTTEYEVLIQQVNDTTFAGPGVGADSLTVVSRSVAICDQEKFLGGYAIFAGAEECATGGAVELDLSGSTQTVNGGIFSNGDLKITGSDAAVTGPVEYRGNLNANDPDVLAVADQYFGSPLDYPLVLEIAEFRPGGPRQAANPGSYFNAAPGASIDNGWMVSNGHATGNNSNIVITQSGIYYSPHTGNKAINLKGVSAAPGVMVTFVAEGQIEVIGDASMTGYAPIAPGGSEPLLLFSNAGSPPACNVNAIQFSGSGITWTGLMFAPNGEVQMSSSSNVAVLGSIIAYTVDISGSDFNITWQNDTSGAPRFTVELKA